MSQSAVLERTKAPVVRKSLADQVLSVLLDGHGVTGDGLSMYLSNIGDQFRVMEAITLRSVAAPHEDAVSMNIPVDEFTGMMGLFAKQLKVAELMADEVHKPSLQRNKQKRGGS